MAAEQGGLIKKESLWVKLKIRASVKLFELGVWYARDVYFRRFHTPSLPISA